MDRFKSAALMSLMLIPALVAVIYAMALGVVPVGEYIAGVVACVVAAFASVWAMAAFGRSYQRRHPEIDPDPTS